MATQDSPQQTDSPRWSITYLFLLTWAVAIAAAPISRWGLYGVVISAWLLCVGLLIVHRDYAIATWVLIGGLGVGMCVLPTVRYRSPAAVEASCKNQVRQIGLALLTYKAAYGEFPPPFTVDENGNRLHSWRVMILPFLQENGLYDEIDLSAPWDSQANQLAGEGMPHIFRCPFDDNDRAVGEFMTNYIIIEGDETIWNRDNSKIEDGDSETILFVESVEKRQHWMSPYNLSLDEIAPIASDGRTALLWSSGHKATKGLHACFCDGSVHVLTQRTDSKILRAMFTAATGDNAVSNEPNSEDISK